MNKPLRIGLTGGIASGKSTVADLFAAHGVAVIDTDVIARQLVEPGKPALDEIRSAFGSRVFDSDGRLDRRSMRELVFSDASRRAQLESILHPRIRAETAAQSAAAGGPYQIIVVPLLVESPIRQFMDRILVVDCDEDTQLRRLLARDAEDESQARRVMAAQASRTDRLAIADDVISNNDDLGSTRSQVDVLHSEYLSLASG
ncbi:MAG: dephospho-CoA kinase [Proteobacteria bacterium]|nr:dephospho-CoA kinase [Pseudomonadota bacterium]